MATMIPPPGSNVTTFALYALVCVLVGIFAAVLMRKG